MQTSKLRHPFEIPFYLVPPFVFSFRTQAFIIWWSYAACHGMALVSHWKFPDNHRMNTSVDVIKLNMYHNRYLNSQFYFFGLSLGILLIYLTISIILKCLINLLINFRNYIFIKILWSGIMRHWGKMICEKLKYK